MAALGARAADRTVIGVDDLHRADQGTLQVLRQLVGSEVEVLVVATFRADEVGPDLRDALVATLPQTADRIVLGGLDPGAARELVRDQLGAELPEPSLVRLLQRAAGSPLFRRHLARVVAAEGPAAVDGLPTAVHDVLRLRLARLPDATVDRLARAAVLGREVDLDVLVAVETVRGTGTEDEVLEALDAGVVAGLLQVDAAGVRFSHALIRDALYETLPPIRRARLHQAVLTVLEQQHPERLSALGYHATAGLDVAVAPRCVAHLVAAAGQALAGGAVHDAVAHLRSALRAQELAGVAEVDRLPVHRRLVEAIAETGDLAAARAARTDSIAAAERTGTLDDRARAHLLDVPSLLPLHTFSPDTHPLVERLQALLAEIGTSDPDLRIQLLMALIRESEPWGTATIEPAAAEALALAEQLGDPRRLCQALNAQYAAARPNHDADHLHALGARMLALATDAGLLGYQALAHLMLSADAVGRADLPAARTHAEAGTRLGSTGQLHRLLVAEAIFTSTARLVVGEVAAASRSFDRVIRQLTLDGDPNSVITGMFCSFAVGYAAGDTGPELERLAAFALATPGAAHDLVVSALLDAGEEAAARARYRPSPWPDDPTWLFSTALATENAYRLGDAATADRTYPRLLPFAGRLACTRNGALALGPVDYFLGVAALALDRPADARRHLDAAQGQLDALGSQAWRGRLAAARERVANTP